MNPTSPPAGQRPARTPPALVCAWAAVLVMAVSAMVGTRPAGAQAALVSVQPADGEVVATAPQRLVFNFNEDIARFGIAMRGPTGAAVTMPAPRPGVSPAVILIDLPALANGTYRYAFGAESVRGGRIDLLASFSVGAPTAAPGDTTVAGGGAAGAAAAATTTAAPPQGGAALSASTVPTTVPEPPLVPDTSPVTTAVLPNLPEPQVTRPRPSTTRPTTTLPPPTVARTAPPTRPRPVIVAPTAPPFTAPLPVPEPATTIASATLELTPGSTVPSWATTAESEPAETRPFITSPPQGTQFPITTDENGVLVLPKSFPDIPELTPFQPPAAPSAPAPAGAGDPGSSGRPLLFGLAGAALAVSALWLLLSRLAAARRRRRAAAPTRHEPSWTGRGSNHSFS